MAETVINKNQAGSGIWTNDTLIAGNNIQFSSVNLQTYEISGFSNSNYVLIDGTKFSNKSNPWNFIVKAKSPSTTSGNVFGSQSNFMRVGLAVSCDVDNNKCRFCLGLSTTGISWNVDYVIPSTYDLNTNTWYFINISYDGISTYKMQLSTDGINYTDYITKTYAGALYYDSSYKIQLGNVGSSNNPFYGTIDVSGCKIIQNGVTSFDGLTATPGSDFTVSGSPTVVTNPLGQFTKINQDLTSVTGYNASGTQVLKNINGVLTWVNE